MLFIACGGKTASDERITPSGNPEKDAAALSEIIYDAYNDNNVELMKDALTNNMNL